ncbi:HAAS signaling domain-containing protein [Actinoplanes sp. CA-252034]|uniref:HAAS signaling domain-containing protein n=1 Tax=Actinoplanes sp. CA-252034 TaxID=3239906 RepID=UPI003D992BAD
MNLTAQDEIAVYVEGVREALAGLPAATRDELLEDLPEHLAEVLAEGGGSLYERLGPPAAYAAELSATAGFTASTPPRGSGHESRRPPPAIGRGSTGRCAWPTSRSGRCSAIRGRASS